MDFKRFIAFFAISLAIYAGWEHFFPSPKPNPAQQAAQQQQQTAATAAAEAALAPATPITVTTDTVKAVIDEKSGDLRQMTLLKYKANGDENKAFTLFNDSKEYTYVAQSDPLQLQFYGEFRAPPEDPATLVQVWSGKGAPDVPEGM